MMKHFGTILVVAALSVVGSVYLLAHSQSCKDTTCFEGQQAKLVSGLAGYTCGCVTNR